MKTYLMSNWPIFWCDAARLSFVGFAENWDVITDPGSGSMQKSLRRWSICPRLFSLGQKSVRTELVRSLWEGPRQRQGGVEYSAEGRGQHCAPSTAPLAQDSHLQSSSHLSPPRVWHKTKRNIFKFKYKLEPGRGNSGKIPCKIHHWPLRV